MSASSDLFELLASFRSPDAMGQTSQQRLFDHLRNVLGSVERMHFDYKQKSRAHEPKLDETDKGHLSEAVSGFANTSGGVLIWGVENDTLLPKPITEVKRFTSELLKLAVVATDPVVPGIDAFSITAASEKGSGFAFIHIPESPLPPHRVALRDVKGRNNYYVRTGESFVVASHTMLEDMFGRRPRPQLVLTLKPSIVRNSGNTQIKVEVVVGLQNMGRGSALSPYLAFKVGELYKVSEYGIDGNRNTGLSRLPSPPENREVLFGASESQVIHPGMTLEITRFSGQFGPLQSPGELPAMVIEYTVAAQGVLAETHRLVVDGMGIVRLAEKAGQGWPISNRAAGT